MIATAKQQPNSQFMDMVRSGIIYWQRRTNQLDDASISRLDRDRQNLYRAIHFALKLPQTWHTAAEVAAQSFPLVERRVYWREWIPLLEEVLKQCVQVPEERPLTFKLLTQLGQLYRLDQQLTKALSLYHQAEAMAHQLGDKQLVAQAHFGLSSAYWENRQHDQAEAFGLMALTGFDDWPASDKWVAATLNTLGLTAYARGDFILAEQRLAGSVTRWRRVEQPTETARTLRNLATALQAQRKFEAALFCYHEAAHLLADTVSDREKLSVQVALGTLYYEMARYSDAEAAFRQANSPALQASADTYYRALAAQALGNVLLALNQLDEAEGYLRHSIELWQQIDDKVRLGNTIGILAELLVVKGQAEAALPFYETAITMLAAYPHDAYASFLLADFTAQRQAAEASIER